MTTEKKTAIDQKIAEVMAIFDAHFGKTFVRPEVSYDLRGKTAGQGGRNKHGNFVLRLNVDLLNSEYYELMLTQTVPHEVAHVVQSQQYPWSKSHGYEWCSLMGILGLPADRCHSFAVTPARATPTHNYVCHCPEPHKFSQRRHNNVVRRRMKYTCLKCKQILVLQS